jgi:hypothetical protein
LLSQRCPAEKQLGQFSHGHSFPTFSKGFEPRAPSCGQLLKGGLAGTSQGRQRNWLHRISRFAQYGQEFYHSFDLLQFKVPRRFEFRELPKTATGKIQKFVLREVARG